VVILDIIIIKYYLLIISLTITFRIFVFSFLLFFFLDNLKRKGSKKGFMTLGNANGFRKCGSLSHNSVK
jgi:hypothetical protein